MIETILKKYDTVSFAGNPLSSINTNELDYNIYLSSERYFLTLCFLFLMFSRIRVPEILFQPSLLGSDQMGIIECTLLLLFINLIGI